MAATVITRAHEVERIAAPIIEEHHQHLAGARILYLFTTQTRKHHTKTVLATAQRLNALQRYLSSEDETSDEGFDFCILVGAEEWAELGQPQRVALVDHELCHCILTPKGEWGLRSHDVEEFSEILQRHGAWKTDVKTFVTVAQQLPLDLSRKTPVAV